MSRGNECLSTSISEFSSVNQDELHRKMMPMIANYDSDASADEDLSDEYTPSSSELNPPKFPAADHGDYDKTLDNSVDSSSSSVDDVDFPDGSYEKLTASNLLNSKALHKVHSFENFSTSEECKVPSSFVVFFYEAITSGTHSTADRRFGEIYNSIESTWNNLSVDQRKIYRKRATNSRKSYSQHLASLREKLSTDKSHHLPVCARPICSRSVISDSRWNLQYCSSDCLIDHCKSIFSSRLSPPVLAAYSTENSDNSNGQVLLNQIGCEYGENVILRDCSVELRQSDVDIACGILPISSSTNADNVLNRFDVPSQVPSNIEPITNKDIPSPEKYRESLFERLQWRSSTNVPLLNGRQFTESSERNSFPFINLNKDI